MGGEVGQAFRFARSDFHQTAISNKVPGSARNPTNSLAWMNGDLHGRAGLEPYPTFASECASPPVRLARMETQVSSI